MEDEQSSVSASEIQHIVLNQQKAPQIHKNKLNLPRNTHQNPKNCKIILFAFLFVFLLLGSLLIYLLHRSSYRATSNAVQLIKETEAEPFPKILWMICNRDYGGLRMVDSILAKHQIQVAKRSGFQVRIVDPINAYDWLTTKTTEMIRRAKHTSLFYMEVAQLLRIGLLLQHGGLSLGPSNHLFLLQDLNWVSEMFSQDRAVQKELAGDGVVSCWGGSNPKAVLFEYKGEIEDYLLMARRNVTLIREVFQQMIEILTKGSPSHEYLTKIGQFNSYENAIYMNNLFAKLLSVRRNFMQFGDQFCTKNAVTIIKREQGSFMRDYWQGKKVLQVFIQPRSDYLRKDGHTRIIHANLQALNKQLQLVLFRQTINASAQSFFNQIINIEENAWLLDKPNRKRQVSFCIISLKPISNQNYVNQVQRSLKQLQKQSFAHWKAVFFVQKLTFNTQSAADSHKVLIVNASEWQGLNLQRAATRYCASSQIGVLLDHDQQFDSENALKRLADSFSDRQVFGAFTSVKVGQAITKPQVNMNFYRHAMRTDINNLKQLAIHLRAFSLNGYRMVPPFDLHSPDGRYYNRQMPLYTLVQLSTPLCTEKDIAYLLKDIERKVEIPRKRAYLQDVIIRMPNAKNLSFKQPQHKSKHNVKNWCNGINQYFKHVKSSFNRYFVLNNGAEFLGTHERRHMPQLIPKKIHQIWIGDKQMPAFKKIFMDKLRKLHPSYEYRLWGNDDITRQNFPQTYDIIQTLFRLNKTSPVKKIASIADFMRLQIVYRHGGFYLDTNYYIFKNHTFDNWLTFRAVWPGQLIPHYKQERENGFFGAAPGLKNIGRLLDHRLLSTRSLVERMANQATGPFYLALAIKGEQELDEQILVLPQDYIYPYYDSRQACSADYNSPPEQLLFKNRYAYRKDCEDIYYWAFGIDFMAEGRSWRPN